MMPLHQQDEPQIFISFSTPLEVISELVLRYLYLLNYLSSSLPTFDSVILSLTPRTFIYIQQ
jgi:hypothetical protein